MVVHDASICSTMVPILISLLIGQMRGTSHESHTAWVGCLSRRRMNHSSCLHVAKGYRRGRLNHSPYIQQTTRGRLNHSPYGCSSLQEVPQGPRSSQSSMSISYRTLIRGSLHDTKSFSKGQALDLPQGLCQNISDLLISPNVMEPYCSLLYHILDKMVPDIYILGAIMKHEIC